jgi:hypothetical protein
MPVAFLQEGCAMTYFADVAEVIEGLVLGSLLQFEPAPDALDAGSMEDERESDHEERQWIQWDEARAEAEWAAAALTSLSATC